jgi:hypothetical protein
MGFTHPRSEVSTVLSQKLAEMVTTKSERTSSEMSEQGFEVGKLIRIWQRTSIAYQIEFLGE